MTTIMHISKLEISLTVQGPFLTQSSAPMDYGLDAALARENNQFFIPGTSVVGKLREAWLELDGLGVENFKQDICDWLGEGEESLKGILFKPKRLHIGNLVPKTDKESQVPDSPDKKLQVNYRIRIDSKCKTVKKGAYLVTERPFAPGEQVTFQGIARFVANSKSEAERLIRHLEIGLKWLSQVGAYRTVGFGEVVGVNVKELVTDPKKLEMPTNLSSYDLIIQPESPFCLAERRLAQNLFKSSEVISGGTVLGALVSMWRGLLDKAVSEDIDRDFDAERPDLGQYFNQIHLTHAFPSTQSVRPIRQPLSLVKADDSFYDVALCEGAGLIKGEAPAFSVDWKGKDYAEAGKLFGWAYVKHELRVRTAINSETRRSADEQLFAYEMIVPTENIAWYARLDLSDIKDESARRKVIEQFQSLIAYGLTGIGKTRAYAQVDLQPASSIPPPQLVSNLDMRDDGVWILSLQTPALLCNPERLTASKNQPQSISYFKRLINFIFSRQETSDSDNQHNALHQAYAQVFKDIYDNKLELERFFATQSLAGGFYLWRRFQSPNNYQPYLLTDAGSVFILRARAGEEKKVKELIEIWANKGLPLPKWAVQKYQRAGKPGNFWSNCPYIPQNGYGEVAVNLGIHWEKNPKNPKLKLWTPITPKIQS